MSCGKCHANREDLTNNIYGKLKVIGLDPNGEGNKDNGWKSKWLCQCECGNIVSVFGGNLISLHTTSCGCNARSIGEKNIENILKQHNINYAKEFTFSDLKDKNKLRFDFAIFDDNNTLSHLIEFDGRQHYNEYTPWNSDETLIERQKRDKLKNDYCLQNNIPLFRIPYGKRDIITLQDLGINRER